jgi:predicted rRNA methylase YqxC with S4 and FtsJ domains
MIEDIIKQTYPVTKKEKCCAMLKAKMEAKREALRKRLNDQQGERGTCQEFCEYKSQVWQNTLSNC